MSVIKRDEIPLEDKFGVYHTWVDHLLNVEVNEAVTLCLDILCRLRCRIPKSRPAFVFELVGHLLRLKMTRTTKRFTTRHAMTETTKLQIMYWLDKLFFACYMATDDRIPLALFRSLDLTLKYGDNAYAPLAFAQTALLLVGLFNDLEKATQYGDHAIQLLAKSDTKALAARTTFFVHSFIFPWTKPLREMFNPLMEAYEMGLRSGDTANTGWSAVNWLQLKLYAGTSLAALLVDFEIFSAQMKVMKIKLAYTFMQPVHQAVRNLAGRENVSDPTSLVGDALSDDELGECLNNPFVKPSICIHQCLLLTYFGEHEKHARLFSGMGPNYISDALMAAPENMINTFLNGLSCFAAAHDTGDKQFTRLGKICRTRIKKWANMGNPNVKHYDFLLDAEYYALQKKNSIALGRYHAAIVSAVDGGFIQDAALASERLAEFHIHVQGDVDEARNRILQSAEYWQAWGALGKVRHLHAKFPGAFVIPHSAAEGSTVSILQY